MEESIQEFRDRHICYAEEQHWSKFLMKYLITVYFYHSLP